MKVRMTATAVQTKMQNDVAAFEGWSLVLMAWSGVKRIVFDWDEPTDVRNGHYQWFLYRLGHFEATLGWPYAWVVAAADHPWRRRNRNMRHRLSNAPRA
jgi:hypothetical protein